jgi:hypothetical protein
MPRGWNARIVTTSWNDRTVALFAADAFGFLALRHPRENRTRGVNAFSQPCSRHIDRQATAKSRLTTSYCLAYMRRMPLRSNLSALASVFANDVLDAIRGASLQELLAESGGGKRRGPGRPPRSRANPVTSTTPRTRKSGRLARRSAEDIAKALDRVVALVKATKNGLRAEEIRAALKMQAKEMPRVLQEGLAKKNLKSKGQKRATTYFSV